MSPARQNDSSRATSTHTHRQGVPAKNVALLQSHVGDSRGVGD